MSEATDTTALPFAVEAAGEGEGFRIEVRGEGQAKTYFVPTGTQQDFSAFFRQLSDDFGTRLPHVFAERSEHPEPAIRVAAAADRKRPPANPGRLRRPRGAEGRRRLLAGCDIQRRARRLPHPPFGRSDALGAKRVHIRQWCRNLFGRPRASTSVISGRRRWLESKANIGSPSPRAKPRTRSPSGWRGAPRRSVRGRTMARR